MAELKYKTDFWLQVLGFFFLPYSYCFNYSLRVGRATLIQSQHLDDAFEDVILKFHYGFLYMHIQFPFFYTLLKGRTLKYPCLDGIEWILWAESFL